MARYLWIFLTFSFLMAAMAPATAEIVPGQLGMPAPASSSAEHIHDFHNFLLWIISGIALFVLALLVYVIFRFNKSANPEPAQFSHNTLIEIIWTAVPVIILIVIVIPSMQLLYYTDRSETPEMTLKVTGYQWFWGYQYPDYEGIEFQSYMIPNDEIDLAKGQKRLLSTDTHIVLPVETNIQILTTAADVLHSWAVPSLGIKIDAIPGRLNETWVRITKPGTYFGQCSELCGKDHAFMPIEIRAVPKEEFAAWTAQPKDKFIYNFDEYKLTAIPAPAAQQETEGQQ